MTAVPVVSEPMGSVLLALSRPVAVRVGGTNSFAAAAQRRMAAQDALNATVGAAGLMRQRAMDAELSGRPDVAAQYSRRVLALNSAIHRVQPSATTSALRTSASSDEESSLEGLSDEELLLEYEWLQADLATIEPGTDPPGAAGTRRRIAHIASGAPRVAETYAELLLFVYNDPDFSCGMTAPAG